MASGSSSSHPEAHSLNRQQILEEDEYTAALSEIIARDFFPSLVHLDATNSYLDALQSEDAQLINASVRRLQDLATPQTSARGTRYLAQTPSRTPYDTGPSDTPARTPGMQSGPNKRPRYDTSHSLDSFQAKYTSEDNASFTEILHEENRKRKEKWGWAWEAQKRARDIKAIEIGKRDRLFIDDTILQPPGVRERLMVETPHIKMIISGTDATRPLEEGADKDSKFNSSDASASPTESTSEKEHSNALVRVPNVLDNEIDIMAPKKDIRSAAVDGWTFKTRNSLMFGPDADISPYDGSTSLPASQPKGPPKEIRHANTRLPEQSNENEETASTAPSSPTRSKIGAAIAGTPYVPRGESKDFPLLPSLPSPTPSQLGPVAVNKLMTWGTITSTPRVLSSETDTGPVATPSTPFHLPGPTPRERVAHKLSSTASRSLRAKASLLSGTPGPLKPPFSVGKREGHGIAPPATPRPHPSLLTPAARRLLDRTAGLSTSAARRAEAMQQRSNWEGTTKGRELGNARWTPSPSRAAKRML